MPADRVGVFDLVEEPARKGAFKNVSAVMLRGPLR